MSDDLLSKCVVDTSKRKIYIYSDGGDERTVKCETVEEFMNVLKFIRNTCPDDMIFYSDPL